MDAIESEGKTVAEAVDSALRRFGLQRDQVEVQILQQASAGFLGMGAKPARVRLTEKLWAQSAQQPQAPRPPSPTAATAIDTAAACHEASALLSEILALMRFEPGNLHVVWDSVQERARCSIDGADAERLISGDGRALEALQFLVTLMASRRLGAPMAVQVDALGYWDKREKEVLAEAEKGVAEVRAKGRAVRLPPMDAPMRRLVHRSLAGHPDVETASEGEGAWRKIVIRPRK